MKSINQIIFLGLAATLYFLTGCKEVADVGGCHFPDSMDTYQLVWSDEFEGASIDRSKWSFDLGSGCDTIQGCGWGNNELEYYTKREENAFVDDGKLVIQAIKESPLYLGQHEYTSARMQTKNKGDWTFGRIDIRAKMPIGQGMWPAIWMLPTDTVYGNWPRSGEIDIMEYLGHKPKEVLGTIHYGHDGIQRFNSQYLTLGPDEGTFHDDFHVFTVLWNNNCIQFQMDGINIGEPNTRSTVFPTTFPFDQDFHLILNIAVGGNLAGSPDASTVFPQRMEVDYVRVYQEK